VNNEQVIKSRYCLLSKCIYKILLFITLTVLIVTCSSSTSKTGILEIRDTNTGLVLGRWFLNEQDEFAIRFIHSVNQKPVQENFRIEDGMLRLQSVRFYSFGAGMQSDLYEGLIFNWDGDAMIISGFNSSFKELNLLIGTVSDHTLFINNEVISLWELAGSRNAHITITYNSIGGRRWIKK